MAPYGRFLGREVTVNYRVGDILLPASGTFVGDSGRSIFLEQHVEQQGRGNYFRWEIPYQYIHRIVETNPAAVEGPEPCPDANPEMQTPPTDESRERSASMAAGASAGSTGILPLAHRPKTA